MIRCVKGNLFADYVRMIRAHKAVDWPQYLHSEDLPYLGGRIDPDGWYPMATFERLGNAILREVARGDVEAVRMWGRLSADMLSAANPMLVAVGDPVDTLRRFRVLRSTYFDFEALELTTLHDEHARIVIHYYMGDPAEQAASFQAVGFFERLLELAGATNVRSRFVSCSWAGDVATVAELDWTSAA